MTTAARTAEADRVELVYYWALNQLGNAMQVDALSLWGEAVPPSKQAARSGANWLSRLIDLIFGFRSEAHELAIRYYRLVRALRTGYTVAVGDEKDGDIASLDKLRDDFEEIVNEIERETVGDVAPGWGDGDVTYDDEPDLEPGDDDDDIPIEDIGDIDQMVSDLDDEAEEQAGVTLDANGVQSMLTKLEQAANNEDSDQASDAAHQFAGYQQAADAMRVMMNAARGLTYDIADVDARCIGYIRYSRTGHPCAFCAMLIGKTVLYKSAEQALAKKNSSGNRNLDENGLPHTGDEYHKNCRCVAVPIFAITQVDSPLYDQNREFDALWKKYISGKFSGKDALNQWRTYLRNGFPNGERKSTPTPALAAA